MAAKRDKSQPRAISQELPVERGGFYRAGMYQELQKFGGQDQVRQLLLSEGLLEADEQGIEITGLDLSEGEDKALHACLSLLDKTDYKGNLPPEETTPRGYKERLLLPRLQISWPEYFDAYGLKRIEGRFTGKARGEAIEALEGLERPRRIAYRRQRWEGKGSSRKALSDVIVTHSPLLRLSKVYKGLEEEEADQVMAGRDIPGRVTSLVIEFSPLLVDRIESFFLLKPITLYQEIDDHWGSKRKSPAVPLFIQWLLTKNRTPYKIAKKHLAKKLKLYSLLEQRKPGLLEKRLQECIQTALALGYLLSSEEDTFGVYTFYLNPERCKRIHLEQPGQEEEEQES